MNIPPAYSPKRGQTALEYLLLLAVVAVVVIASFSRGSLIDQVHNAAGGYYNTITNVIMGENPNPIDGGWCPVTCPPPNSYGFNIMYGTCECPAPAFGGAYCPGGNVSCGAGQTCKGQEVTCGQPGAGGINPCGPCPTGQSCVPVSTENPTGCSCIGSDGSASTGLHCGLQSTGKSNGPIGSVPDSSCQHCICPYGTYPNGDANNPACLSYCPQRCTTYNGSGCVPVTCQANATCDPDPKLPISKECQCDNYAYASGFLCVPCQAGPDPHPSNPPDPNDQAGQCTAPNKDHTSCMPINCSKTEWCDKATNKCECITGTTWDSKKGDCVSGTCTANPACPGATDSNASGSANACGTDSCGIFCGNNIASNGKADGGCPPGSTCSSTKSGTPGTCVSNCLACQSWDASSGQCVTTTPCATSSNACGQDSCGKSCGNHLGTNGQPDGGCASGSTCSSTTANTPGICACVPTTPCGSSNCGTDSCGVSCGTCGGASSECVSSTPNGPGTCCTPTGPSCGNHLPGSGLNCGSDSCGPCGNLNGGCAPGTKCSTNFPGSPTPGAPGSCDTCSCAGKNCGDDDGCGDTCQTGSCPAPQTCNGSSCVCPASIFLPSCGDNGAPCGTNIGGICGCQCTRGLTCTNGGQNVQPTCQCVGNLHWFAGNPSGCFAN